MKPTPASRKSFLPLFLVFLFLSKPAAPQQPTTNPSETALLQSLLEEVRNLRLAMERSAAVAPRMQLTIARFQMQQEKVDRVEQELDTVATQLSTESIGRERLVATLKLYEDQAREAADATIKKQFEDGAASARTDLEQQSLREQSLLQQQSTIRSRLATEQTKLNDLSAQLDKLDKLIQPHQ